MISTIRIYVHAVTVADGIGLQESARERIIVPGAVVVQAYFYVESSAGEHVGVGVVDVFYGDLAVDGVFVCLDGIAGRVA